MASRLLEFLLGEGPRGTPPERVRWLIAEQQVRSEVLIGWVQFALVSFFLLLYTFSPKTSAGTQFQPVPWVLAAFFGFTLLRLLCAYRRWLRPPLLVVGVAVDMALLMGLIWSFHLQYEQPAPFYLKAPTLLYVFLFIALRALRFEPLYVAAAGVAAATGWLILLVYAAGSGEMVVTRDYVHYMTSNSVLVGAEIDKIISILMVTAVLALGLARARRILFRAVLDSVLARDLSRFVAPEVADRISSADRELKPGDGEVREASVLFTDIEGFSTISEKVTPERLVALLNAYFEAVSVAVERHGGAITQFQGDAMLVTFNAIGADPEHAASAVRCALAIQEATRERDFGGGVRMRTRCGINTGRIVTGAVGTRERLLYTVHGDEVNVAARLEQSAEPWAILCGERTARAARDRFTMGRPTEIEVKGKRLPILALPLLARAVEAPLSRLPLVGRDDDLRQLELVARRAFTDRRPFLVSLVAPAGGKTEIGKAKHLALAHRNAAEDLREVLARAHAHEQFFEFTEAVRFDHAAGIGGELPDGFDVGREPGVAVRGVLFALQRRRGNLAAFRYLQPYRRGGFREQGLGRIAGLQKKGQEVDIGFGGAGRGLGHHWLCIRFRRSILIGALHKSKGQPSVNPSGA